jgi:pimeloyl-ACP methyl ester carboxylesterase
MLRLSHPFGEMNERVKVAKSLIRRLFLRVAIVCVALYILAFSFCAVCQRRFIYVPPVFTPVQADQIAGAARLERWTNTVGQQLGWKRLSSKQPGSRQVLLLHGNAGCAIQCGRYADVLGQVAPVDVFIAEYPGYADHPGTPTEQGLYQAGEEAFQNLAPNSPVILIGESLGTGVATYLAGRHPNGVAGLVLLAPYNSLANVAQFHMPIFPVRLLVCDRFPSEDYLLPYHGPIAFLLAGKDPVIPEKFGRRLYDAYIGPKRLWEFPQGGHGTVMIQPANVWGEILEFLENESDNRKVKF